MVVDMTNALSFSSVVVESCLDHLLIKLAILQSTRFEMKNAEEEIHKDLYTRTRRREHHSD